MKTNTTLLFIMLTIPLLVACANDKAVYNKTNGGGNQLSGDVSQNQRLNVAEVEKSKQTKTLNTASGQKEIIAASSYQKPVVYAKSKGEIQKEEKKSRRNKKNQVEQEPVKVPIIIVKTVETPKDTVAKKPAMVVSTVKVDSAKPVFDSALIAPYLRTPSHLKKFSVVVGTFSTLEKASIMLFEMEKIRYKPVVVPNEKGMYRVIVSTYDKRNSADLDVLALDLDSIKAWVWAK